MTCTTCMAALWGYEIAQGVRTCRQCRKPKPQANSRRPAAVIAEAPAPVIPRAALDLSNTYDQPIPDVDSALDFVMPRRGSSIGQGIPHGIGPVGSYRVVPLTNAPVTTQCPPKACRNLPVKRESGDRPWYQGEWSSNQSVAGPAQRLTSKR
jgi:hypothetical protein